MRRFRYGAGLACIIFICIHRCADFYWYGATDCIPVPAFASASPNSWPHGAFRTIGVIPCTVAAMQGPE
uniref:Uncharacterized protein n=1 Tax=Anopheles braziliensis TaxID=58242 RepID=A0A2M3ZLQ6_9DIPT